MRLSNTHQRFSEKQLFVKLRTPRRLLLSVMLGLFLLLAATSVLASISFLLKWGSSGTADGQFCSPDNTNCDAGVLSNTGFVYEHTFAQAGTYSYFCALHCFAGMTGVINVRPPSRPHPTPRPRPSPHPRPVSN